MPLQDVGRSEGGNSGPAVRQHSSLGVWENGKGVPAHDTISIPDPCYLHDKHHIVNVESGAETRSRRFFKHSIVTLLIKLCLLVCDRLNIRDTKIQI